MLKNFFTLPSSFLTWPEQKLLGPQIKVQVTTKIQKNRTVYTEMFSVHGGTVNQCCMRQCPVANCSIAEHQRQRRLSHQQLDTATEEHSAGVSVRAADVAACRTNVANLQPGRMVPCRSVSNR